jgi:phosphatidylglycerophosphatase A
MTGIGFQLVTTFGLGYMRPASGTWGSMPPVVVAAALIWAGLGPHAAPWTYHLVLAGILVVFSLACLVMGDRAEARFLKKDPGQVVADETAGQCLSLAWLPASALATPGRAALTLLGAFVAFRAMDVIKPWPARQLQRLPGGWGILVDDLFAGLYAAVIVQIVARVVS